MWTVGWHDLRPVDTNVCEESPLSASNLGIYPLRLPVSALSNNNKWPTCTRLPNPLARQLLYSREWNSLMYSSYITLINIFDLRFSGLGLSTPRYGHNSHHTFIAIISSLQSISTFATPRLCHMRSINFLSVTTGGELFYWQHLRAEYTWKYFELSTVIKWGHAVA
jgi:hypothetical protein